MTGGDLAILGLYAAFVLAVGALLSLRPKTTEQYFLAGRAMPWWAIAASLAASETSTFVFLSIPGAVYAYRGNFSPLLLAGGVVLGRVVVSLLFVPRYLEGGVLTVYELLGQRFGGLVRGFVASLFLALRTVADGLKLLVTGLVLSAIWVGFQPQLPPGTGVVRVVLALGFVTILVALLGGIEAVVWVEAAQLLVCLGGALAAGIALARKVPGGLSGALTLAGKYGKLVVDDDAAGYAPLWAGLVGGCFLTMASHGADQNAAQRYLCTDRLSRAAAALIGSSVVVLLQTVGFLTIGVLLFAFYTPFRYPFFGPFSPTLPFNRGDLALPHFLTHHVPHPAVGFVFAALLASGLSSSLSAVAATTINDVVRPLSAPRPDRAWLNLGRVLVVVAGALQMGVALVARRSPMAALDRALAALALFNGPILGIFLVQAFTRRAGKVAALAGFGVGLVVVAVVKLKTAVPWPWYTAIGSLTTLAVATLVGLAFPGPEEPETLQPADDVPAEAA